MYIKTLFIGVIYDWYSANMDLQSFIKVQSLIYEKERFFNHCYG